jgi:hypothetical protein
MHIVRVKYDDHIAWHHKPAKKQIQNKTNTTHQAIKRCGNCEKEELHPEMPLRKHTSGDVKEPARDERKKRCSVNGLKVR